MHLPVAILTDAKFDDALFWNLAQQLLGGHWLGTYSNITLAKGPGFSFFLALNAIIGVPITLSIALFYLFACWLVAITLRDLGVNRYFVLVIFIVILFQPELFPLHIIRDNIYPALSLIVICGAIRMITYQKYQNHPWKQMGLFGLVLGFFWLTREEGVWIVPGMLLLIILKMVQLKIKRESYKSILKPLFIILLTFFLFVGGIACINFFKYGKLETVDFKEAVFSRALTNLNSVYVGEDLPFLPVSFAKRKEIYKISPSFLQLKDYFEDKGKWWTRIGYCDTYPQTCGDYGGATFMWALRDAVASKGYYDSPIHAENFYNNINKEIEKACSNREIVCKPSLIPFIPNIPSAQLKNLPKRILFAFKFAMVQIPVHFLVHFPDYSDGFLEPLDQIRSFLGNPKTVISSSNEHIIMLQGWYYSSAHDWISLKCSENGATIRRGIDRLSSADIANAFNDSHAYLQRFLINLSRYSDCSIVNDSLGVNSIDVKLKSLKESRHFKSGHSDLQFDVISDIDRCLMYQFPLKIKDLLMNLYRFFTPGLVFFGVIAYLFNFVLVILRKKYLTDLFIVSTMIWVLFFSRVMLLVLFDISSFLSIIQTYMSPAILILDLVSLLSIALMFEKYEPLTSTRA